MLKKSIKIKGTGRLPRYDFGTTAAQYGSKVLGYDESKKWADYSGVEKASTVGIGAGNVAAAGLGAAGMYMKATDSNTSRFTERDATANTLSNIGSNAASMGAAGAAFGPWGAAAGLVGGAVLGAVTAGSQNKKMRREQVSTDSISGVNAGYDSIANIGQSNDISYNKQVGMVGMDKGTDKFYSNGTGEPNAMIANEEAVVSNNGNVDIVGGNYNSSNPDTVVASLEDGTSILPKNKMFKLPGGKSTPADIARKVSISQKNGEKIMNDPSSSFIDKNTAMLNRKNTDKVIDTLRIYSDAVRAKNGVKDQGKQGMIKADTGYDGYGTRLYNNNVGRYVYPSGVPLSNIGKQIALNKEATINQMYGMNTGVVNATSNGVAYSSPNMTQSAIAEYAKFDQDRLIAENKSSGGSAGSDGGSGRKFSGFDFSSAGNALKPIALSMAVGSSMSQYNNATPEVITPSQYTFTGSKYRSNLYNQLRDIQSRENIARYNNRVSSFNSATSTNANAALQYNSNNAYSNIYDTNYKALNNYDNANLAELNRIKNLNIAEAAKTRDINSRSRAVARNIKYAAIQDIAKTIYPHTYTDRTA